MVIIIYSWYYRDIARFCHYYIALLVGVANTHAPAHKLCINNIKYHTTQLPAFLAVCFFGSYICNSYHVSVLYCYLIDAPL